MILQDSSEHPFSKPPLHVRRCIFSHALKSWSVFSSEIPGSCVTISPLTPSHCHNQGGTHASLPGCFWTPFPTLSCPLTSLLVTEHSLLCVYIVNLKHTVFLLTKNSNILNWMSEELQKISPSFTYTPKVTSTRIASAAYLFLMTFSPALWKLLSSYKMIATPQNHSHQNSPFADLHTIKNARRCQKIYPPKKKVPIILERRCCEEIAVLFNSYSFLLNKHFLVCILLIDLPAYAVYGETSKHYVLCNMLIWKSSHLQQYGNKILLSKIQDFSNALIHTVCEIALDILKPFL